MLLNTKVSKQRSKTRQELEDPEAQRISERQREYDHVKQDLKDKKAKLNGTPGARRKR